MPKPRDKWHGLSGVFRGVSKRNYTAARVLGAILGDFTVGGPGAARLALELADRLMHELEAKPNARAFPALDDPHVSFGLTHREAIAIEALCGLIESTDPHDYLTLPRQAVRAADELLEAIRAADEALEGVRDE